MHLERLYRDVAEYNAMVQEPVLIGTLVDNAVRTSPSRRTVTHLTVPVDAQEADPELQPFEGGLGVGRAPHTQAVHLSVRSGAAARGRRAQLAPQTALRSVPSAPAVEPRR